MSLYGRLMGLEDFTIHQDTFVATLAEFARGRLTGAQAQEIISVTSGAPLSASEMVEAQDLLATINGTGAAKLQRVQEINDVTMLCANRLAPYDTEAAVKARLGV